MSSIKPDKYIVNSVEKLEELRNELGILSWDRFAILLDCSPSNIYDHVYSNQDQTDGGLPEYEKILQLWHIKLFTLINYLNKTGEEDLLDAVLTPISLPKSMPKSIGLTEEDTYGQNYGKPVITGTDLKALSADISLMFGINDPEVKRGPGNGRDKTLSLQDQLPLTNFMAELTGIAMRTYSSYVNSKEANTKKMRGIVSKIYTVVSYLYEEDHKELIEFLSEIDDKYIIEYGRKRLRVNAPKK